jgi:hypothetical protein
MGVVVIPRVIFNILRVMETSSTTRTDAESPNCATPVTD